MVLVLLISKRNVFSLKNVYLNPKPEFQILIYLMVIIFTISLISTLTNFTAPVLEYVLKPVKVVLIGFLVYYYVLLRDIVLERALLILMLVCFTNSIVVYLQYFLDFFYGLKTFLYHPDIGTYTPYRKPGLTTGFPTSGIISVVSAFLSFYFYFKKSQYIWLIIFFISSLSVFLSARSAMYLYILLMPVLLFYFSFYFQKFKPLFIAPMILVTAISFALGSENNLISGTVDKMFANVINYMETGSFHDYSTRHLVSGDHLSFPDNISTIVIGNSLDKSSGFQPSDISFVRIFWSNGILALSIYILAFILVWYFSIRSLPDRPLKVLFFSIFFVVFVMLFKGPYLFSTIVGPLVLFLFVVSILNNRRHRIL
jgi:hypothetical protein